MTSRAGSDRYFSRSTPAAEGINKPQFASKPKPPRLFTCKALCACPMWESLVDALFPKAVVTEKPVVSMIRTFKFPESPLN